MISIDAKSKGRIRVDTSKDVLVQHEDLRDASYSGLKGSFTAVGCTFERCHFHDMHPQHFTFGGGMEQTRYLECSFDGSKFTRVVTGQARFERCSFIDVDIKGFFGHMTEFIDCVFSGVLRGSVFYGKLPEPAKVKRQTNEFRGNDFSRMRFVDVGFRHGVDLSLQQLPQGDEYLYLRDAHSALQFLREMYLQKPASPLRQAVFQFLQIPEEQVRAGQTQLFLCKSSERTHLSDMSIDTIWNDLRHIIAEGATPSARQS